MLTDLAWPIAAVLVAVLAHRSVSRVVEFFVHADRRIEALRGMREEIHARATLSDLGVLEKRVRKLEKELMDEGG